jgi:hypothetical protein
VVVVVLVPGQVAVEYEEMYTDAARMDGPVALLE